jgi:hypothetical protein
MPAVLADSVPDGVLPVDMKQGDVAVIVEKFGLCDPSVGDVVVRHQSHILYLGRSSYWNSGIANFPCRVKILPPGTTIKLT